MYVDDGIRGREFNLTESEMFEVTRTQTVKELHEVLERLTSAGPGRILYHWYIRYDGTYMILFEPYDKPRSWAEDNLFPRSSCRRRKGKRYLT